MNSAPWVSYDTVAETYERVAVPWFEDLARDLVDAVALSPGECLLDVGTGTGLTAAVARGDLGSSGLTIGIDPSMDMLRLARSRRGIVTAAAALPGLPFRDATFDAVVANLVLSHVPDLAGGLTDLVRALRPGGRLGFTAWAPDLHHPDDQKAAADDIVAMVREECGLPSQAPVPGAPWEEQLRNRAELASFLTRARLLDIDVRGHTYRRVFTVNDYLSGWGGLDRYLRWEFGDERWREFSDRAATELRQRFHDGILSVTQAWVATGKAV
ncbi:MAG TPA: methyltransferase domain-containing protein [Acidimicrobiales bacterium]|nr:methyltransferase domain-containing protein [Acidimicrobiales bacterium]